VGSRGDVRSGSAPVAKAIFTRPNVTLRLAGSSNAQRIEYQWSTTIKLKRIVKKR
jgi:hypothetical protein